MAQLPDREAFLAFWRAGEGFKWRQLLPHALYVGPLLLAAIALRLANPPIPYWLATGILAVGYVFLMPFFGTRLYWKRYAPFIRCHQCGDWFGWDESGNMFGPNPKWKTIARTGRCYNCGAQVLRVDGSEAPQEPGSSTNST